MARPRLPRPKTSITLTLFAETIKAAKKLGMGNVSLGLDTTVKKLAELEDEATFLRKTLEEERAKTQRLTEEKMALLEQQIRDQKKIELTA